MRRPRFRVSAAILSLADRVGRIGVRLAVARRQCRSADSERRSLPAAEAVTSTASRHLDLGREGADARDRPSGDGVAHPLPLAERDGTVTLQSRAPSLSRLLGGEGARVRCTRGPRVSRPGRHCAPFADVSGNLPPYGGVLVGHGAALVATDYEGLGTPGEPTPYVGIAEGHAVLDSVRAAGQLPGTGRLGAVLLAGHSQGGGAVLGCTTRPRLRAAPRRTRRQSPSRRPPSS